MRTLNKKQIEKLHTLAQRATALHDELLATGKADAFIESATKNLSDALAHYQSQGIAKAA